MVYFVDRIPRPEAAVAQRCVASLLSNNLKTEYSEMCGFVRARMLLSIVLSNTLLLRGARDKEAKIRQRLDLSDEAVISLLAPWWD